MKKQQSPMSEEIILANAWELLSEDGIEKFSMRRLADKLGIQAPSLYWYFKSKQTIYQRLASQISKIIINEYQGEGEWQDQLREMALTIKNVLSRYPCSTQLMMMSLPLESEIIIFHNRMLLCVENTPLDDKQKLQVVLTIMNYVFNFVLEGYEHERSISTLLENEKLESSNNEAVSSLLDSISEREAGAFKRMFKSGAFNLIGNDDAFQFGLKVILLGIQQIIQEMKN